MKRMLCVLLMLTLLFMLCSCSGKNIEQIVQEAQAVVASHEMTNDGAYKFSGEYMPEEKLFTIYMPVDLEALKEVTADVDPQFKDMMLTMGIENLDSKTETHKAELLALKNKTVPLFEDTDVIVLLAYVDAEGEIILY